MRVDHITPSRPTEHPTQHSSHAEREVHDDRVLQQKAVW